MSANDKKRVYASTDKTTFFPEKMIVFCDKTVKYKTPNPFRSWFRSYNPIDTIRLFFFGAPVYSP